MAKKKNIVETRLKKRQLWVERTSLWSGLEAEQAFGLLETPRTQSLRVNSLLSGDVPAVALGEPISWCPGGYEIAGNKELVDDLADQGLIYVQNAASWLPVLALRPAAGDSVLDVCAAPGGKSSHIQALAGGQAELLCNDNSKPRLLRMQSNLGRLGVAADYSLADASRLARALEGRQFDKILLDAPCSGEGMMTTRDQDLKLFDSWSPAHIRRLSDLQKKILTQAWQLLKPDGTLVYSTCTMAPEENEAVVDYLLRRNPDAQLTELDLPSLPNTMPAVQSWNNRDFAHDMSRCLRLAPGKLTEAFFVAKIQKDIKQDRI